MNAILWLLSPIGRYLALAIGIAAAFGGFVLKQRHDAVQAERARVEERKANDINRATTARQRVRTACERDKSKCLPNDWYRD
jgi:hypothetical protein